MKGYDLQEFIDACKLNEEIGIYEKARKKALELNLETRNEIIQFIANGGLEYCTHQTSKTLKYNIGGILKDPLHPIPIIVDAYTFVTGRKMGYISFLRLQNGGWFIKSLCLSVTSLVIGATVSQGGVSR